MSEKELMLSRFIDYLEAIHLLVIGVTEEEKNNLINKFLESFE